MWALADESGDHVTIYQGKRLVKMRRLNLEPSLVHFRTYDFKLKSLIMAQIERWRQA